MKWILTATFLCLLGLQSYAAREVQNGGGGISINGSYLTYYSATGKTLRQPVEASQNIPGLDLLLREIVSLPLSTAAKSDILNVIDNSPYHQYYRLQGDLDLEIRKEIVSEYSRLYKIPQEQVVIFAVTNDQEKATVLLPEFYTLRTAEQSAILMHESLWLSATFTTYNDVVDGEQITQAYLENKSSPDKFYAFLGVLNKIRTDRFLTLKASLAFDLQNQRFPAPVMASKKMLAKDFFGENFMKSIICTNAGALDSFKRISRELYFEMRFNYTQKQNSLFYRALADELSQPLYSIWANWTEPGLCDRNNPEKLIKDLYIDFGAAQNFEDIFALPLSNSKGKLIGYFSF
ncbi:MAG: hypothetical protein JSU04_18980 [Bdellovibrionales bacterium]|nr:hypothetical protein [Bdellovibrionales bacterium]